MARHPVPGRVKTRLARTLGPERACALYRAFVLDLADRLRELPYAVTWAYEPASAPFAELVPDGHCRPQEGGDLGERMERAIERELEQGSSSVLVIGADVPHVPADALAEARALLLGTADVVLGPAEDGGYYLVGVRAPAPMLFTNVPWGTSAVLRETLARATAAGLRARLLAPSFDVDEERDLVRLADVIAHGDVSLPRTERLLRVRGS